MAEQKIGIKVADGTFYPILDEDEGGQKRLVLTTVTDEQESVQVDLYRGSSETVTDASYVGSLLVENISKGKSGETEIEMILGIDEDGNLQSTVEDKAAGAKQSLSVSLENLGDEGLYEVPDFNVEETSLEDDFDFAEENEPEEEGLDLDEEELDAGGLPDLDTEDELDLSGEDLDLSTEDLDLETEDLSLGEETLETGGEPDLETEDELGLGDEDFDFGGEDFGDEDFGDEDFGGETGEPEDDFGTEDVFEPEEPEEEEEEEKPSRGRPVLVAILVLLALALIGALLYLFVFLSKSEESVPALEAENAPLEQPADSDAEAGAGAEASAESSSGTAAGAQSPEAEAETPEAEAPAPQKTPAEEPSFTASGDRENWENGVWYRIRWGDTLWGISSSFYDSPWFFNEIADENEIYNPDRIYAEEQIFIPKPD